MLVSVLVVVFEDEYDIGIVLVLFGIFVLLVYR